MLGHFRAAKDVPSANPSHLWELLLAHRTEGGRAEREEEEGGYSMEGGKDSREEGRENEWGEDTNGSLGKGSGARGASTSRDDDYLRGRADGTTEAAEDVRGWKEATQRQGRSGGLKVSVMRKGGRKRQAGDGDGAVNFTEQIRGDENGSDKARRQRARGNDGDNGVMAPPQSAAGAAHGGGGGAV